jgi:signal transduction histidine kinase
MRSLYRRLTVTHTMVALLAVVLIGLLASSMIWRAYRQITNDQAQRQSRAVAEQLSRPLSVFFIRNRGWEGVAERAGTLLDNSDIVDGRILIADSDGRIIFDSDNRLEGRPIPIVARPLAVPVIARGETVGSIIVEPSAERREQSERTFIRSLIVIVTSGSIAAAGAALIVALFVARRLTRPLNSLTQAARRLAAGGSHEPIPPPADAELAELATAFNTMAAELEHQEQLRRTMVADIAHELRTPLSVLRLQVESMEDGIITATPKTLAALGGELDVLSRLVDDLRLISLAESGQLSIACEALDPQTAIEQAVSAAMPRAQQRNINLQVEARRQLPAVLADPQRLAQVLGNLIENALRYTPDGGSVTLSTAHSQPATGHNQPEQITFSVSDTGPGIAPADQARIFERFYRTDRARAREKGGSGLGLAIVQRLVLAQGGTIDLDSTPGRGSTFRVSLPVARP